MNKIKTAGIYKITNTITKDFYIGSSTDIFHRWQNHKYDSKNVSKKYNLPLYVDFRKFGIENFQFEILEETDTETLKAREQFYIELYKPTYNQRKAVIKEEERKAVIKEYLHKYDEVYYKRLCRFNNETLTFKALILRFNKIYEHPTAEAKKYLLEESK